MSRLIWIWTVRNLNCMYFRSWRPEGTDSTFYDRCIYKIGWLVGWLVGFEFMGPLRQYFSLYRAVSQREEEKGKKG